MKTLFRSYEFLLFCLLVLFSIIIGLINPAFFSIGTLFDVIRIQTINLILALGLLSVIILGGVDISFVAIAALSSFPIHMFLYNRGYEGGIGLYFLLAILVGGVTGAFIAFLLTRFKLGIFDLSLGMNTMIYGFITFFVGSLANPYLPQGMVGWNKKYVMVVQNAAVGETGLHVSFIFILIMGILLHLFLNNTTLGRGIFAIGSNKAVAIRTGFNLNKIYFFVFPIMVIASGIAGVVLSTFLGFFNPIVLMGKNMQVLAGVILGGASITGGKGSVIGTFLGVLLIGLVNQAMVYLGIDTQWFDAAIGIIFIIYATFQVISSRATSK
ncbi:MAG: ABC transporter permease [Chloroflexi bacterium]|nr:ABC transporter permease [Chloroflexota bacterium]